MQNSNIKGMKQRRKKLLKSKVQEIEFHQKKKREREKEERSILNFKKKKKIKLICFFQHCVSLHTYAE